MGRGRITRKDDPEDQRRVDEIEGLQPLTHREYDTIPGAKLLQSGQFVLSDDGTDFVLIIRRPTDGKLYKVALTEIT